MRAYKTKAKKFSGTSYPEIRKKAFGFYQDIKRRSKRRPYVRSTYFKKDKVFLALFWSHLHESKNYWDQMGVKIEKDLPLIVVYEPRAESLSLILPYHNYEKSQ